MLRAILLSVVSGVIVTIATLPNIFNQVQGSIGVVLMFAGVAFVSTLMTSKVRDQKLLKLFWLPLLYVSLLMFISWVQMSFVYGWLSRDFLFGYLKHLPMTLMMHFGVAYLSILISSLIEKGLNKPQQMKQLAQATDNRQTEDQETIHLKHAVQ